jgi:hypothetical protein
MRRRLLAGLELEIVESGNNGMRRLRPKEEEILHTSQLRRDQELRRRRIRRYLGFVGLAGCAMALLTAAGFLVAATRPYLGPGVVHPNAEVACPAVKHASSLPGSPGDFGSLPEGYRWPSHRREQRIPVFVPFGAVALGASCPDGSAAELSYRSDYDIEGFRTPLSMRARVALVASIQGHCGVRSEDETASAGVGPRWSSVLTLPQGRWRTSFDLRSDGLSCFLSLDGRRQSSTQHAGSRELYVAELRSGDHAVSIECGRRTDYRGGCTALHRAWLEGHAEFSIVVDVRRV